MIVRISSIDDSIDDGIKKGMEYDDCQVGLQIICVLIADALVQHDPSGKHR